MKANSSLKNVYIEGLRCASILLIAVHHLLYKYTSSMAGTWAGLNILNKMPLIGHWGELGVAVFLIITSYFLYSPKENKQFKLGEYYKNKFFRLWPSYFLAITITYLFSNIVPYPNYKRSISDYLLNVFWINGYMNMSYIDGAHWYMTVLVSLIAVNGIIRKLQLDKKIETYIIWVSIAGIAKLISQFLPEDGALSYISLAFAGIYKILGGGYIGIACMGIAYHMFRDSYHSLRKIDILKYGVLLIVSSAYTIVATNIYRLIFTFIAIGLLEFCLRKGMSSANPNWLIFMGAVSYPFYLIHQQLGYIIENQISVQFYDGHYSILIFIITLIITFLAGLLIYYLTNKTEELIRNRS